MVGDPEVIASVVPTSWAGNRYRKSGSRYRQTPVTRTGVSKQM